VIIQKVIKERSLSNRSSCQSHNASLSGHLPKLVMKSLTLCYTAQQSSYCIYIMLALLFCESVRESAEIVLQ